MPGIDGYETCRRFKADPRWGEAPVLFLTALGDPGDKMQGFAAGAVDYILSRTRGPGFPSRSAGKLAGGRCVRRPVAERTGRQPSRGAALCLRSAQRAFDALAAGAGAHDQLSRAAVAVGADRTRGRGTLPGRRTARVTRKWPTSCRRRWARSKSRWPTSCSRPVPKPGSSPLCARRNCWNRAATVAMAGGPSPGKRHHLNRLAGGIDDPVACEAETRGQIQNPPNATRDGHKVLWYSPGTVQGKPLRSCTGKSVSPPKRMPHSHRPAMRRLKREVNRVEAVWQYAIRFTTRQCQIMVGSQDGFTG